MMKLRKMNLRLLFAVLLVSRAKGSKFTDTVQRELEEIAEQEILAKKLTEEVGADSEEARQAWAKHSEMKSERKR